MPQLKKRGAARRRKRSARLSPIHNANEPMVSVIIPAMNERRRIAAVIRQAAQVHSSTEVIVVVNGSTDGTERIARRIGARVVHYDSPLGHDVGRSIGADHAKGQILLFTDADILIKARQLRPLVRAVEQGIDIALNQYIGPTNRTKTHGVVLAKHSLNIFTQCGDLSGESLTTIPHAMNRKALETIGSEHLAVPPLAQAIAVSNGLQIKAVHYIEVGKVNPRRFRGKGFDPLEHLIIGDHLEALHWYTAQVGARGNREDLSRNREAVR